MWLVPVPSKGPTMSRPNLQVGDAVMVQSSVYGDGGQEATDVFWGIIDAIDENEGLCWLLGPHGEECQARIDEVISE